MSEKEKYPVQERKLLGVVDESDGLNEFQEQYENGELQFIEVENSYFYSLVNLRLRFFAIILLFEEACRAAPNRKARKQCQQFVDMFKKQISDVGFDEDYERFLITGLTPDEVFNGEWDRKVDENGTEA